MTQHQDKEEVAHQQLSTSQPADELLVVMFHQNSTCEPSRQRWCWWWCIKDFHKRTKQTGELLVVAYLSARNISAVSRSVLFTSARWSSGGLGWLVAGVLGGWRLGPWCRVLRGLGSGGVALWCCGFGVCGAALACPLCLVLPLCPACVLACVSLAALVAVWSSLLCCCGSCSCCRCLLRSCLLSFLGSCLAVLLGIFADFGFCPDFFCSGGVRECLRTQLMD